MPRQPGPEPQDRQTKRISKRQIQADGETFSGFVLARRLDRGRQRLTDGADARPVGATAFDVGIGDLPYFNRTIRRRFGLIPSQAQVDAVLMTEPAERRRLGPVSRPDLLPVA